MNLRQFCLVGILSVSIAVISGCGHESGAGAAGAAGAAVTSANPTDAPLPQTRYLGLLDAAVRAHGRWRGNDAT